MKKGILSLFLFLITQLCWAQFNLPSGKPVKISCDNAEEKVVHTALDLLSRDCKAVLSASLLVDNEQGDIIIGTVGKSPLIAKTGADLSCLKDKKQAFLLIVLPDGKLLVAGSDAHGTAYGIMELSRLIGVSAVGMVGGCGAGKKDIFHFTRRLPNDTVSFRRIPWYLHQ